MPKAERDPYKLEVGERLRLTVAELGMASAARLAEHLHLERKAVDAWFNGRALPPVPQMTALCERWGLTLDWIYRQKADGLPLNLSIRLTAAVEGMDVPVVVEEPQPAKRRSTLPTTFQPQRPVRRGRQRANENSC